MIVIVVQNHGLHGVHKFVVFAPDGPVDKDGRMIGIYFGEGPGDVREPRERISSAPVGNKVGEDAFVISESSGLLMKLIDVARPETGVKSIAAAHLQKMYFTFHRVESMRLDVTGHHVLLGWVIWPLCPGHHHEVGNPIADWNWLGGICFRIVRSEGGAQTDKEKKESKRVGFRHDFRRSYHKSGGRSIHCWNVLKIFEASEPAGRQVILGLVKNFKNPAFLILLEVVKPLDWLRSSEDLVDPGVDGTF